MEWVLVIAVLLTGYVMYWFKSMTRMNKEPIQAELARMMLIEITDPTGELQLQAREEILGILMQICGTENEAIKRLSHAVSILRIEVSKEVEIAANKLSDDILNDFRRLRG